MAKKDEAKKVETTKEETVESKVVATGEVVAGKDDVVNTGEAAAPAKPKIEIIRGRMPLPIVHQIKFGDEGLTDGAMAAKFRTTNGKVSDIRKDRNFGYVKEDYVPSTDMINKAIAYAEQLEDKSVLEILKNTTPATDEQNAAFDASRKSTRPGRPAKKADVETPPEEAKKTSAEDLTVTDGELAGLTE